jgi:membrane protein implicated in regulation of membrane protease activity
MIHNAILPLNTCAFAQLLPAATFTPSIMELMDFFQWHWWAGLAIVLLIAEIFVPGFFLLCLGIGCVGGSLAAAMGAGSSIQLLAFSSFALIAFFTIRPLLMKQFWKDGGVRTNVDALIGQHGKVSQDFEAGLRLGRVSVGGDDWRAECINDSPLHVGDLVQVVRVESNTIIVKPVHHV